MQSVATSLRKSMSVNHRLSFVRILENGQMDTDCVNAGV